MNVSCNNRHVEKLKATVVGVAIELLEVRDCRVGDELDKVEKVLVLRLTILHVPQMINEILSFSMVKPIVIAEC